MIKNNRSKEVLADFDDTLAVNMELREEVVSSSLNLSQIFSWILWKKLPDLGSSKSYKYSVTQDHTGQNPYDKILCRVEKSGQTLCISKLENQQIKTRKYNLKNNKVIESSNRLLVNALTKLLYFVT